MITILLTLGAVALLAFALSRLAGFAAQRPSDYAGLEPGLDLRRHFDGPMLCEGVIYGPFGRVSSRFVAEMHGRWEGNRGTMDESFRYASGDQQRRRWHLTLAEDGAIRAEAADLTRPGHGRQQGAAARLCYRIRLPEQAGGWVLDVTDWMYLMENGTIINRSQFRKYGVKVAELVATMRRVPG